MYANVCTSIGTLLSGAELNVNVDPTTLSLPQAVDLAFRGDEYVDKNGNTFPGYGPGSKRGNPSSKDGYLLIDLKVQYNFQSGGSFLNLKSKKIGRRRSTISAPSRQAPRRRN